MLHRLAFVSILALAGLSVGPPAVADVAPPAAAALEKAQALFKSYVDGEARFDPAVADLYADDAVIKNRRTYPDGQIREMTLPAPRYKELVRSAMPVAKQRGDTSKYSNCKYTAEGERVRIACNRYSNLKKYDSPLSLLVGPGPKGAWLIFEELSASQP